MISDPTQGTIWQRRWANSCTCLITTSRWILGLFSNRICAFVYLFLCICICVFAGEVRLTQPGRLELHRLTVLQPPPPSPPQATTRFQLKRWAHDTNLKCELMLWAQTVTGEVSSYCVRSARVNSKSSPSTSFHPDWVCVGGQTECYVILPPENVSGIATRLD